MTTAETLNVQRCAQCQRARHCARVLILDGVQTWTCRHCSDALDDYSTALS